MMKKNKLYTVTRFNKPLFMPKENLFAGGGSVVGSLAATNPSDFWGINSSIAKPYNQITGQQYLNNFAGKAAVSNPLSFKQAFSSAGLKGALNAGAGAAIGAGANLIGGLASNAISGGLESTAGNAISGIGSTVGSAIGTVNPILGAAVGVGSQLVGGLFNAAFGTKVDQAKLNAINANTAKLNSFVSNAGTFDEIKGPEGVSTDTNAYSGGWFSSSKARRKNAELKEKLSQAKMFAQRSVDNNIFNVATDQVNDALANYSAFGGPLDNNVGAIGYDLMTDYLTTKRKNSDNKNQMTNLFMGTPKTFFDEGGYMTPDEEDAAVERAFTTQAVFNTDLPFGMKGDAVLGKDTLNEMYKGVFNGPLFAFGGDLQTHGGDFGTGLTHVNAGKSHEENPYDGVQMGVDSEGTPNLVEEGEVIYNDYVYSQRITLDDETKKKFKFPKKRDITYADAAKKLEKEIAERPNDPISQAGFEAQMQTLADAQERQKAEMEAQRAKEAFEALSPEEQTAIMQQATQQEAMAQEAAVQQPTPEEVAMAEQQAMQADGTEANLGTEPPMMAEGGHLFKDGGSKNSGKWKDDKENHWDVYTKPGLKKFISSIKERLDKAKTEEEKAAVRLDAMKQFNDLQKSFADIYPKKLTDNYKYSDAVKNHQMMFDKLFGNTGFYSEDEKGNVKNLIEDAINMPSGHATSDKPSSWYDGYFGPRTSIRNFGSTEFGDDTYYQELANDFADLGLTYAPSEDMVYNGNKLYGLSIPEQEKVQKTLGQKVFDALPQENQEAVLAAMNGKKPEETVTPEEEELDIEPVRKSDWMRYAGLFGPAVGLGMMAAGIGKPDYSKLDAAVDGAGNVHLADYKPLGDYLTYRPMDIWYEQNRMDAQARATDRALANSSSPSKMAGLLANGYNSQLASGELYRKALEYNDALREKTAAFNRGTNQFNAEAYNRNSQFNADAQNRANQYRAGLAMQAASERLNRDAGWYNSLYGNINGLFRGLSDLGRENRETNWRNALVTSGAMGVVDPEQLVRAGVAKKKGKKGLTV